MTRKEMIIIAALVNAGILAILFMTAGSVEDMYPPSTYPQETPQIARQETPPASLVSLPKVEPISIPIFEDTHVQEVSQVKPLPEVKEPLTPPQKDLEEESFVQITVKRGDFLQKIAKANGTTVEAIRKVNGLKSERIAVGQILKIPVKAQAEVGKEEPKTSPDPIDGAVYYTIKSGDNPWKLARQFHVPFEELLRLNKLDEDKAKNLKIGDKIRVR